MAHRSFWGPLIAILDFAVGAKLQTVSECPLRLQAGISTLFSRKYYILQIRGSCQIAYISKIWFGLSRPKPEPRLGLSAVQYQDQDFLGLNVDPKTETRIKYFQTIWKSWKFLKTKIPTFNPVTGVCKLCISEKFTIVFKPEVVTLNSRNEIFSACRHKKAELLVPPDPKSQWG